MRADRAKGDKEPPRAEAGAKARGSSPISKEEEGVNVGEEGRASGGTETGGGRGEHGASSPRQQREETQAKRETDQRSPTRGERRIKSGGRRGRGSLYRVRGKVRRRGEEHFWGRPRGHHPASREYSHDQQTQGSPLPAAPDTRAADHKGNSGAGQVKRSTGQGRRGTGVEPGA